MSNVGQSQLCRNGISSPCVFSGLFYCYFKGINLLKKRELIFRSLNWTIIDVLGPEFDSWVPPWSYFGGSHITSQLDWTAWLILCVQRWEDTTVNIQHICCAVLYTQTSSLFKSKTIVKLTRNQISTWNQSRPLGSSAKSNPSRKDKHVSEVEETINSVTGAHAWSHESAILGAIFF